MARDPLEPGQDDLVKEERPGSGFVRKMKDVRSTGLSGKDDIYTDHKAGDPSQLTPAAERDRSPARRSGGDPVRGNFADSLRNGVEVLQEVMKKITAAVSGRGGRK